LTRKIRCGNIDKLTAGRQGSADIENRTTTKKYKVREYRESTREYSLIPLEKNKQRAKENSKEILADQKRSGDIQ